jgi:hypothetical protein
MSEQSAAAGGYLLVETQVGAGADTLLRDGLALVATGAPVKLFLVADAVATAVRGASDSLAELVHAGAQVWVDEFTLAQRALPARVLADGVSVTTMDTVADALLTDGVRTVWH